MVETILGAETRIAEKETEKLLQRTTAGRVLVASSSSYSCSFRIRHSCGVGSPTKSFSLPVLQFCSREIFVRSGIQSIHA